MLRILACCLPLFVVIAECPELRASNLPNGFSESQYGGESANIPNPTAMAFAPDGRLFVCQQDGRLRVIKQGALLAAPFLTVDVDSRGERGLLGVAFDPNFLFNHYVYVYYTTRTAPVHNRVSRFLANGDIAVPGREMVLIELDNLSAATNHNGGAIHFGKDGRLYIATGENANPSNSQSLNTVLGKILRIESNGAIPADNPYFTLTAGKNRAIWAFGLRNPFTFNFQPGTGRMFINDVGQDTWEEINEGIAGSNYGWPVCEGECPAPLPRVRNPMYSYSHAATGGCAIAGGTFYNPAVENFPASYNGKYFFADLCGGFVGVLDPGSRSVGTFATTLQAPVDLQTGPDGALYYLQIGNGGQVWRISYSNGSSPANAGNPANPQAPGTRRVPLTAKTDYDGDGLTDIAVFKGSEGLWSVLQSSNGAPLKQQWGAPGDFPVPGDYDGDGKTDFAVWRRSEGIWYVIQSSTGATASPQLGIPGDIPVPGDYDGDGKTDFAVWRPGSGLWYVTQSSSGTTMQRQLGAPGDIPVPGDYDGDGRTDFAVWRPGNGTWYVNSASNGVASTRQWGLPGDAPVTGDYDGDGKTDFAVWRESDGIWYVIQSSDGTLKTQLWGIPGDTPVNGDFDGDGKTDFAVWRESDGIWYVIQSSNSAMTSQQLGTAGDIPVSHVPN
jgi:glucose/arabinose dehydrogenase